MKRSQHKPELPEIADEPGWQERFQRGLKRALTTPPQHRRTSKPSAIRIKKRPDSAKTEK
jgi:hypothetical protein